MNKNRLPEIAPRILSVSRAPAPGLLPGGPAPRTAAAAAAPAYGDKRCGAGASGSLGAILFLLRARAHMSHGGCCGAGVVLSGCGVIVMFPMTTLFVAISSMFIQSLAMVRSKNPYSCRSLP